MTSSQGLAKREPGPPALVVTDIAVRFGGIVALDGISFQIDKDQICALIGPNGAGKTTLFNVISRFYQPRSGSALLFGQDLLAAAPHDIASLGIARTVQNIALFPSLSVLQNVLVGAHSRIGTGLASALFRPRAAAREERALRAEAMGLLDLLDLREVAAERPAGLPFGTQKRVEIARALMARPRLLMLDEPANGLNRGEVRALAALIRRIREDLALSILLVEHHMEMVASIADKVVVLDFGRKIAEGTPQAIAADPAVIEAYLGRAA